MWIIVPLSAATALDVCFSNLSLQYGSVATYTMTKSTSIIFTLVLTFLMRLQRLSWQIAVAVAAVGSGVLLTNASPQGGINGDWRGILCALIAAGFGSLRWVLTEKWFARPGVENNAFMLIVLLSPVTVLTLVPVVAWEMPRVLSAHIVQSMSDLWVILGATIGGGILATAMVAIELQFVSMSSALSLTVVGTLKDLLQIGLAMAMFGEHLSPVNALGVAMTLAGSAAYGYLKRGTDEASPLPIASGDATAVMASPAREEQVMQRKHALEARRDGDSEQDSEESALMSTVLDSRVLDSLKLDEPVIVLSRSCSTVQGSEKHPALDTRRGSQSPGLEAGPPSDGAM